MSVLYTIDTAMSINNCMNLEKVDGIIACGDSYTLGPRYGDDIHHEDSWPSILGKSLSKPVSNVSRGGASNTEISLQPLKTLSSFKSPLLIFGFTVDIRYPFFTRDGILHSMNGLSDADFEREDSIRNNRVSLAKQFMQQFLLPVGEHTGMQNLFVQSVKTAMAYKKLNPSAQVIWGNIHSQKPTKRIKPNNRLVSESMYCFNSIANSKPLQSLIHHNTDAWISPKDSHPNKLGCTIIADSLKRYISQF